MPKAWNKIVSETDDVLVDLINDVTEKLCGFKTSSGEVAGFIDKHKAQLIIPDEISVAAREIGRQQIYLYPETRKSIIGDYTRKRLVSFNFAGKKYGVRSWRDMLLKVCEILHEMYPKDFQKVLSLGGVKRSYFSRNPNELRDPVGIAGTDIFADANLSAKGVVRRCRKVLSVFGYGADSLRVETE